jgi:NADPH-dependent curcumin reductase CurA
MTPVPAEINRRWRLRSRPDGRLTASQFEFESAPWTQGELAPGQVLVRTLGFLAAPTLRNWLNAPSPSFRVSIGLGETMRGPGAAEVVHSAHSAWPRGSRFTGVVPWADHAVVEPDTTGGPLIAIPDDMSPVEALGPYGVNALTAYFGLREIACPRPGETVVVSAAAGSVGTVAVQIAKLMGCRVIGIAGGRAKCDDWVVATCGADAAIDYRSENVSERLRELCPSGVDVYFDNVGGAILQAVLDNTSVHARVALCGQVSAYDADGPAPGPRDMMRLVYWRIRLQGFLVGDFLAQVPAARADLRRWIESGRVQHREDVRHGLEALPVGLVDVLNGANAGTLIVLND